MSEGIPRTDDPGRIVAHRGASRDAPENTLAAFRRAAEQGARWLEFDVMLLGDGTPVVHHDASLDRCTDATGPLAALELADLAAIHAGVRFGDAYPEVRIPTLAETLDLMEELGLFANLEMKLHGPATGALAEAVGHALTEREWAARRLLVSCFDHDELARLRRICPGLPVAVLYHQLGAGWRETAARLAAAALHIEYTAVSASMIAAARREGLDVRIFTINDPDLAVPLREAGLAGVITDHPPLFLDRADWADWAEEPRPELGHPNWAASETPR